MPTEKILTGYPSIDKPWLKYYSEEEINAKFQNCVCIINKRKNYPPTIVGDELCSPASSGVNCILQQKSRTTAGNHRFAP